MRMRESTLPILETVANINAALQRSWVLPNNYQMKSTTVFFIMYGDPVPNHKLRSVNTVAVAILDSAAIISSYTVYLECNTLIMHDFSVLYRWQCMPGVAYQATLIIVLHSLGCEGH